MRGVDRSTGQRGDPYDTSLLLGGTAVGVGGALIGLFMALKDDEASVQAVPLDVPILSGRF